MKGPSICMCHHICNKSYKTYYKNVYHNRVIWYISFIASTLYMMYTYVSYMDEIGPFQPAASAPVSEAFFFVSSPPFAEVSAWSHGLDRSGRLRQRNKCACKHLLALCLLQCQCLSWGAPTGFMKPKEIQHLLQLHLNHTEAYPSAFICLNLFKEQPCQRIPNCKTIPGCHKLN